MGHSFWYDNLKSGLKHECYGAMFPVQGIQRSLALQI